MRMLFLEWHAVLKPRRKLNWQAEIDGIVVPNRPSGSNYRRFLPYDNAIIKESSR